MKIAFCFLVYDNIVNEELWKIFFDNVNTNKYHIYIHYKVNKPLKYFNRYKIINNKECSRSYFENTIL